MRMTNHADAISKLALCFKACSSCIELASAAKMSDMGHACDSMPSRNGRTMLRRYSVVMHVCRMLLAAPCPFRKN